VEAVAETQLENFHLAKGESTASKLVIAEEVVHGHVSWKAIKLFLGALGGKHVILFFSIWKLIMEGNSRCFSKSSQCLWPASILITALQLSLCLFSHLGYTGHDKPFLIRCLCFDHFEGLENYQLMII